MNVMRIAIYNVTVARNSHFHWVMNQLDGLSFLIRERELCEDSCSKGSADSKEVFSESMYTESSSEEQVIAMVVKIMKVEESDLEIFWDMSKLHLKPPPPMHIYIIHVGRTEDALLEQL